MIINWQTFLSTFLLGLLIVIICFLTGFVLFFLLKYKRKEKLGSFTIDFTFKSFLWYNINKPVKTGTGKSEV